MKTALIAIALSFLAGTQTKADFTFEEDHGLPVVYLNVALDVGAVNDPLGKNGLANLASRMILRGTQTHSKTAFFEKLNRLGGQLEVDVRSEGTVFRAAVLSEHLDAFLALFEEALTRPKFTSEELRKLKSEIEGLILEQKGNDQALVQYHFNRFLYGNHPYGNPVIGTRKGVSAITYKDVVDFYADHFSGQTLSLFGSGDASDKKINAWFENLGEKLSAIHPQAKPVLPTLAPALPVGRRTLVVNKPRSTQAQVLLGGKGIRPEAPGFYAILLANHSYGGPSFQARMMREIRVKRGWTYGASNTFRFGQAPRHFAMYVFPKTADAVPAVELMLSMFEDFIKNGITREEFEFARSSLVNNAPFNYDTPRKRLENATTEYLLRFPKDYFKNFARNVAEVKHDEIAPALRDSLKNGDLALTVVGDKERLVDALSRLPSFAPPAVKHYDED